MALTGLFCALLLAPLLAVARAPSPDLLLQLPVQQLPAVHTPTVGIMQLASKAVTAGRPNECDRQLAHMHEAVIRHELWALKMLDASGAPGSGFLFGNVFWLGSLSECLDVNRRATGRTLPLFLRGAPLNHSTDAPPVSPVTAHFLVATFTHTAPLQEQNGLPNEDLVTLGLCVPTSCSPLDLRRLLATMFAPGVQPLPLQRVMDVTLVLKGVRSVEDDSLWLREPKFVIVMSLLILAVLLALIGSLYDVYVWQPHLKLRASLFTPTPNNNNTSNNNNEEGDERGERSNKDKLEQFQLLVLGGALSDAPERIPKKGADSSDRCLNYEQGWVGKVLLCFSVPSNTRALLDPRLGPDSVACLHGLRFMGMAWIIMVHTVFYLADYCDNRTQAFRMAEGVMVQVVSNSTLSVDTFFFLSGFLIAYLYYIGERPCKDKIQGVQQSSHQINAPSLAGFLVAFRRFSLMVLRRFIRLTPVYMMVLGILDINQSKYARTSLFTTTERADETCGKYWWRNLLYINNFYTREDMCMSWSWYISNDMQFFVIGTFLLLLSSSYRVISTAIVTLLLVSSCAVTGWVSWYHGYVPTLQQQFAMLNVLYDPPWTRIGPYLVGMVTGWLVVHLNGHLPLGKRQVALGWVLGSACNLVVLFGLAEREISPELAAVYVGVSRTVWGVGLAWLVVACSTGHAGIISTILEFPGWVPFSRLTFCAYLLNPLLMGSVYLGSESAMHVDFLPLATYFLGHLSMCYICAYVLSLLFESPNILIMRWLIGERAKKQH